MAIVWHYIFHNSSEAPLSFNGLAGIEPSTRANMR
jgi:hypothetical protein